MSKLLIVIIVVMFSGAFAIRLAEPQSLPSKQPLSSEQQGIDDVPYEAAFSGEYVCLPHTDTSGPQTLECALGLKLGDGTFIALDLLNSGPNKEFATNSRIRVIGTFVPIEQISSDHWRKYPITGILQVKVVEKI